MSSADSDAPLPSPPAPEPDPAKERVLRRKRWLKWGTAVVVVGILVTELVIVGPVLTDQWKQIRNANWTWVGTSITMALASMFCFGQVQRSLLRPAGVTVTRRESTAVILASNSISQTMPGGQVLAPAFIYRETRKWGATPVVASWQVVMSGLLFACGLALLGLAGASLAGLKTNPFSIVFSVAGLLAFAVVVQYLATHPETVEAIGIRVLRRVNSFRKKSADHGVIRMKLIIEQLQAVRLGRRDVGLAFTWTLLNRLADVACLAYACWAVGVHPSVSGLMVAYAAGKAVGSAVPLLPGGIGVVDAVIISALVGSGVQASSALAAVVLYRLISYLLVSAIGWVVIAFRYRGALKSTEEDVESIEFEQAQTLAEQRVDIEAAAVEATGDAAAADEAAGEEATTGDGAAGRGTAGDDEMTADQATGEAAGDQATGDEDGPGPQTTVER